jgi:isopropylmalate/homocitrate/citramalate synthase
MTEPWIREQWFSSPQTFSPEVQGGMKFPRKIELLDLTLDENGEGMAGAHLTEEQKLTVAQILDEIGVHRIGVLGYPARVTPEEISQLEDEVAAARKVSRLLKNARPVALATTRADIDRALQAGARDVVIRKYLSHVQDIEPEPNEKKIEDFIALGAYARERGLVVAMLAQGITRASMDDIEEILGAIHREFRLDEVCLTDTHGVGTPQGYKYLVERLKRWLPIPFQVHCHNHLGLGVANACFAVAAGAEVIHTTVHGLGHFSGLAPLEEVAVALPVGYGVDLGLCYERLFELSRLVERYTGIEMPPHKPVVGMRAFVMSNDAFYNQLNLDRARAGLPRINTLPYLPELVGNRERVYLGEGLTRIAVVWNLRLIGVEADDADVDAIFAATNRLSQAQKRAITDEEFAVIVDGVKSLRSPVRENMGERRVRSGT